MLRESELNTYPKSVTEAVRQAVQQNAASVEDCIADAEKRIRNLPEFDDLVSSLVTTAVSQLVNKEFAKCDALFIAACGLADIPPTKRQKAKWRRGVGEARTFLRAAVKVIREKAETAVDAVPGLRGDPK